MSSQGKRKETEKKQEVGSQERKSEQDERARRRCAPSSSSQLSPGPGKTIGLDAARLALARILIVFLVFSSHSSSSSSSTVSRLDGLCCSAGLSLLPTAPVLDKYLPKFGWTELLRLVRDFPYKGCRGPLIWAGKVREDLHRQIVRAEEGKEKTE